MMERFDPFKRHAPAWAVGLALAAHTLPASAQTRPAAVPPNILVIMADDLGWSDIEPYGSEIDTPYLNELSRQGVHFTNFFVSPYSSPSRAMFLTGADNHEVGLGNLYELNTPEQAVADNYVGHLTPNSMSFPQRLQQAGYYTVLSGKWHLGKQPQHQPQAWGFDDAFALLNGEANNYRHQDIQDSPDGRDLYSHNGADVQLPEGAFASDFYTDYLLEKLSAREQDKPFFAFLSYTAPHSPLQAPEAYAAKYARHYHDGPQVLAQQRLGRLKQMGLVARNVRPHPLVNAKDWQSLSGGERAAEAKRMQLYAAMIDNMDHNIGRVMRYLKETGQYDNTVVVFLSDNGAAGASREASPKWGGWIRQSRDNRLENMGKAGSYVSTGAAWAQASMTPFALFKGYTSDGGIRSPLIIKGPRTAKGKREGRYAAMTDLAPTLLDFAGLDTTAPAGKTPLAGNSLKYRLAKPDARAAGPDKAQVLEMRGGRQVRLGRHKAVYLGTSPAGIPPAMLPAGRWRLFDIISDPGETRDIAAQKPELLEKLIREYEHYSRRVRVVELSPIRGNTPPKP